MRFKELAEWKALATSEPLYPWGSDDVMALLEEIERLKRELREARYEADRWD